jgi:putative endonuclease
MRVRFPLPAPAFAKATAGLRHAVGLSKIGNNCPIVSEGCAPKSDEGGLMHYVYILQSIPFLKEHYVGYSEDLKSRIKAHNSGDSAHTKKFKPWRLVCYVGFEDERTAKKFEYYLKTGSGRAFLKKRLLKLP